MSRRYLFPTFAFFAALSAACGGPPKGASSAQTTQADLSAIDQLKSISVELQAGVDDIVKPIEDASEISSQIGTLPKRLGMSAATLRAMLKASAEGGRVSVQADAKIGAEAKAEVAALAAKVEGTVASLKATPDKVAALSKKLIAATAKVPLLATEVSVSATATVSNPFAGAESKAKAQADLGQVKQVQADVQGTIDGTQKKITEIPALAAKTLAKLTASLAGSTH